MLARHELDDISKHLLAAADKLEQEGHVKGARQTINGYCALGAIGACMSVNHTWSHLKGVGAVERLAQHLPGEPSVLNTQSKIAYWNNAEERTAAEVIDKFREVAYDPQYALVTA